MFILDYLRTTAQATFFSVSIDTIIVLLLLLQTVVVEIYDGRHLFFCCINTASNHVHLAQRRGVVVSLAELD